MVEQTKFGVKDFKFSKKMWMSMVWLTPDEGEPIPYFLNLIKTSKSEAIEYAKKFINDISVKNKITCLKDRILLTPLLFLNKLPA